MQKGVLIETERDTPQRILVLDDDEVVRELLVALLSVQGFEVTAVSSGQEALSALGDPEAPSVVLTDLQMPGLEGEALTQALRTALPAGGILIGMSGRQQAEQVLRPLDGFLLKPFDSKTLVSALVRARDAGAERQSATPGELPSENTEGSEHPVLDEVIFAALGKSFQPHQLHELYALTLRDVESRVARMEASASQSDWDEVRREAHSIKGGCGLVGARELGHIASRLEVAAPIQLSELAQLPLACERLQLHLEAKLQQKW